MVEQCWTMLLPLFIEENKLSLVWIALLLGPFVIASLIHILTNVHLNWKSRKHNQFLLFVPHHFIFATIVHLRIGPCLNYGSSHRLGLWNFWLPHVFFLLHISISFIFLKPKVLVLLTLLKDIQMIPLLPRE